MLHTQILMPVQDANTSHTKPCALNPYTRAASQKCKHFLTLVQAPNASHENTYYCTGSQQFKQLLALGKPPKNSKNSLCQCRLLTLHMQILMLLQVPDNSDIFLRQEAPESSKNSLHN
ncbi:hypothetical protein O181_080664 [Austropuccinia psidii MF-1]|uniref:Uncharacterized protein n=1 Tax=Austropuccinia psidii MF-1 TaxID=1389203 RepID=A0A9Q3FLC5_9BASI|nr:hypothetical protein [Austropuccinia psidii MF-1]